MIWFGGIPFFRDLSVTSAHETPARKRKSGAGSVPLSCDHLKKCVARAEAFSHESYECTSNINTQANPRSQSM